MSFYLGKESTYIIGELWLTYSVREHPVLLKCLATEIIYIRALFFINMLHHLIFAYNFLPPAKSQ